MVDISAIVDEIPVEWLETLIEMFEQDTMKEIVEYREKQTVENQQRVDVLMQLIRLEQINEQVIKMESFPEAENLLKKISKSG